MADTQALAITPSQFDRDEELRSAHQRAFSKILAARSTNNYQSVVKTAVRELVDACEAFSFTS